MALEWVRTRLRPHRRETGIMRKIEREPNGAGIFRPGQDLVVAGTIGKNGVKAALSAKEKEISARFPEWFVKRIREQADKKLELTPAAQENGKKFRRAAYWPPFGLSQERMSREFPLN
jgi:hypothetical protein